MAMYDPFEELRQLVKREQQRANIAEERMRRAEVVADDTGAELADAYRKLEAAETQARIREHQATQDSLAQVLGYWMFANRSRISVTLNMLMHRLPCPGRDGVPMGDEQSAAVQQVLSDILHELNRNGGVHDARRADIERLRGVGGDVLDAIGIKPEFRTFLNGLLG